MLVCFSSDKFSGLARDCKSMIRSYSFFSLPGKFASLSVSMSLGIEPSASQVCTVGDLVEETRKKNKEMNCTVRNFLLMSPNVFTFESYHSH